MEGTPVDSACTFGNYVSVKIRWKLFTIPVLWGTLIFPVNAETPLSADAKADGIVVLKSKRELQLMKGTRRHRYQRNLIGLKNLTALH